jgi:hypothetical protein
MALGYGFGPIMLREPDQRRQLLLKIGLSATALFLVLVTVTAARETPSFNFRLLVPSESPDAPYITHLVSCLNQNLPIDFSDEPSKTGKLGGCKAMPQEIWQAVLAA